MRNLYDVHSHLIPGVDDGAADMEESIRALEEEYRQGIQTVICTPHISARDTLEQGEKIRHQFYCLQIELKKSSIGENMKLYLGNELYYSDSILELLKDGIVNTMAGSQYVLVEFSPSVEYRALYQGLRNLLTSGYLPILAHMERYPCLVKEEHLEEIEELGVYLQTNAPTVCGGIFNATANRIRKLLKQGRIQLLGSDTHGMNYRPPGVEHAVKWIEKNCSEETSRQLLYEYPQAIIDDFLI